MKDENISIFKIIWTDYASFVAAVFPLFFWAFYFILPLLNGNPMSVSFLYIVLGGTVVAIFVLILRARLIVATFETGDVVDGQVIQTDFFRDRGRITYVYDFQGERYQSGNAVVKNHRTKSIVQGQSVKIVVSRDNPKQAFIQDLYL